MRLSIEAAPIPIDRPAAPAQGPARPATARATPAAASSVELSAEALALIAKLKARDTQVRQHEQAHLAAAGALATSGATYSYQRGPDGVNYAVGGEVRIDTSAGSTPQDTIARAQAIIAAALAPADPSGADRAVAAQAQQMAAQARAQLLQQTSAAPEALVRRAYSQNRRSASTIDVTA